MTTGSLEALLDAEGIQPALAQRLARYGVLLLEANRRFNLSGADTPEEVVPHLLDSLTLVPFVREPYVDVGSGGGFPAIPLALACGIHVTMIESTAKKAEFLRSVLEALDVPGTVFTGRAEQAGRDAGLREHFQSGTARAVASASTVVELVLPLLAVGGAALLQRGKMDDRERNAVTDAAPMLGGSMEEERDLGGERRILVVRKLGSTPGRFPRRTGVPEKRPLCL